MQAASWCCLDGRHWFFSLRGPLQGSLNILPLEGMIVERARAEATEVTRSLGRHLTVYTAPICFSLGGYYTEV